MRRRGKKSYKDTKLNRKYYDKLVIIACKDFDSSFRLENKKSLTGNCLGTNVNTFCQCRHPYNIKSVAKAF